jgi:hypothetical protein
LRAPGIDHNDDCGFSPPLPRDPAPSKGWDITTTDHGVEVKDRKLNPHGRPDFSANNIVGVRGSEFSVSSETSVGMSSMSVFRMLASLFATLVGSFVGDAVET